MKYRTYKKWNKKGFFVMKGEKSRKRNKKGKPVFGKDQVAEKDYESNRFERCYHTEYDESDYEITAYDLGFDWA